MADAAFQVQLPVLTPRPMPFQFCLSNLSDIWIVKDSDDDSSEHTVLYFFSLHMSKIIYRIFLTYIHTVHMLKLYDLIYRYIELFYVRCIILCKVVQSHMYIYI